MELSQTSVRNGVEHDVLAHQTEQNAGFKTNKNGIKFPLQRTFDIGYLIFMNGAENSGKNDAENGAEEGTLHLIV